MKSVCANYITAVIKIVGFAALVLLSGCHRNAYVEKDGPMLPCKVQGACDSTIINYMTKFNRRGIKAVTIGQDYLISIPAVALFEDQTAHLKWASYGLLNDVALFLKQFRKVAINVNSYSSKYISVEREHALTIARSRVVAEYLWTQGVDSRLIFTQGLGSDKPIVAFLQGGDASPNARVEITFRRAVA